MAKPEPWRVRRKDKEGAPLDSSCTLFEVIVVAETAQAAKDAATPFLGVGPMCLVAESAGVLSDDPQVRERYRRRADEFLAELGSVFGEVRVEPWQFENLRRALYNIVESGEVRRG